VGFGSGQNVRKLSLAEPKAISFEPKLQPITIWDCFSGSTFRVFWLIPLALATDFYWTDKHFVHSQMPSWLSQFQRLRKNSYGKANTEGATIAELASNVALWLMILRLWNLQFPLDADSNIIEANRYVCEHASSLLHLAKCSGRIWGFYSSHCLRGQRLRHSALKCGCWYVDICFVRCQRISSLALRIPSTQEGKSLSASSLFWNWLVPVRMTLLRSWTIFA
jgi:hypothetical protein